MSKRVAMAGSRTCEQAAARDAQAVQDAVNIRAIVGSWHEHLIAMGRAGLDGDELNNHPTTLLFLSKLLSLTRFTSARETEAFEANRVVAVGGRAEYEVIEL